MTTPYDAAAEGWRAMPAAALPSGIGIPWSRRVEGIWHYGLLTGDQSFVNTYKADRLQAENGLKEIKELVADNHDQTHNIQDIMDAMGNWDEHADILIAERAKGPVSPDWMKLGATLSDQAQRSFEQFVAEEERLRDTRLHRVRSGNTRNVLTCLLDTAIPRRRAPRSRHRCKRICGRSSASNRGPPRR